MRREIRYSNPKRLLVYIIGRADFRESEELGTNPEDTARIFDSL